MTLDSVPYEARPPDSHQSTTLGLSGRNGPTAG